MKIGDNLPRPYSPADAPPAAVNRELRRLWAAEVNRVLRRTTDPDEALEAGAVALLAALDCDVIADRAGRAAKTRVPVNLPVAARRREMNSDGAGDRIIELILAGATMNVLRANDPDTIVGVVGGPA